MGDGDVVIVVRRVGRGEKRGVDVGAERVLVGASLPWWRKMRLLKSCGRGQQERTRETY